MDEIIKFCEQYGISNVLLILATMLTVNLIKFPLKKHAKKIADCGMSLGLQIDKSFVTGVFSIIPFIIAMAYLSIKEIIIKYNAIETFDYIKVINDGIIYGGLSVALYEVIVNQFKSIKSGKGYRELAEIYQFKKQFYTNNEKNKEIKTMNVDNLVIKNNMAFYDSVAAKESLTNSEQASEWYKQVAMQGVKTLYISTRLFNLYFKCESEGQVEPITLDKFRTEWGEDFVLNSFDKKKNTNNLYSERNISRSMAVTMPKREQNNNQKNLNNSVDTQKKIINEQIKSELKTLLNEIILKLD